MKCENCDGKGYWKSFEDIPGQEYATVYQKEILVDCPVCNGTGEVEE